MCSTRCVVYMPANAQMFVYNFIIKQKFSHHFWIGFQPKIHVSIRNPLIWANTFNICLGWLAVEIFYVVCLQQANCVQSLKIYLKFNFGHDLNTHLNINPMKSKHTQFFFVGHCNTSFICVHTYAYAQWREITDS